MKRNPTTVCHIPNRIRVKAVKCKSCRIGAPIRQKPLRSVMSYPNWKMVSVENTGLPHKLHTTAATRHLAPKARLAFWVWWPLYTRRKSSPVPTEPEAGWASWRFGCFGKRHKSPHTGNLLALSQSLYLDRIISRPVRVSVIYCKNCCWLT